MTTPSRSLTTLDPSRLQLPSQPALEGLENKWMSRWEQEGVYRFDRTRPRAEVFSIDTPPPTVSGSLHVGHVFSYTHPDIIARFYRMCGKAVFYPMGWDDNGLPTERRVQNYYGVRCDPSLPYDPSFAPPDKPGKQAISVSRPNFVELCARLTAEDEKAFEQLWKHLGLSVDWSMTYATIDQRAQRISQVAFLRLLKRGQAYQVEAPTLWDVDFRTAVAQAELEDREMAGAYHRVRFGLASDGGTRQPIQDSSAANAFVEIETSRPELIPACVALVAHPDDVRYQPLFGTDAITPLFGVRVPVKAHPLADPQKGSGLAMICTFGDITDVTWWRELGLPVRAVVQPDGTLRAVRWGTPGWESVDAERAQRHYDGLVRLSVAKARAKIVEDLRASGDLVGDPRPITHAVKFYEKGDRPLEIVTSRQWFVKTLEFRDALLARGRELHWHPSYMQTRYENWVNGLNGDWCISRQRFFGVPFPVWYSLDESGRVRYERPILAEEEQLPVDPSTAHAPGCSPDQRGQAGGFIGDPDIMDTWATSSLTPQIVCRWEEDPDLFVRTFPMDLRPQAHDIIRTWLFVTVLRSHLDLNVLPWAHAAISGFVVDPDRKKMSKSKGNVVTPLALLDEHGSDAVRYWAASVRSGSDTPFDTNQMRIGRRLAIKLLNASRFVLSTAEPAGPITATVDRAMLSHLGDLVGESTTLLEQYEYGRVLERVEREFWGFCDDYLEFVKGRRYGEQGPEGAGSANSALVAALSVYLRLFAPFLPFVTEEVWSWWRDGSIHRAPWPVRAELAALAGEATPDDHRKWDYATLLLGEVRKRRSEAKQSMKVPIVRAVIGDTSDNLVHLDAIEADLRSAGRIAQLERVPNQKLSVDVEFESVG
jgi:valyl-tRNA synthetase